MGLPAEKKGRIKLGQTQKKSIRVEILSLCSSSRRRAVLRNKRRDAAGKPSHESNTEKPALPQLQKPDTLVHLDPHPRPPPSPRLAPPNGAKGRVKRRGLRGRRLKTKPTTPRIDEGIVQSTTPETRLANSAR